MPLMTPACHLHSGVREFFSVHLRISARRRVNTSVWLIASYPFGLTNQIIDGEQYTVPVLAIIASAVIPTLIAQRYFSPEPVGAPAITAEEAITAIKEASEIP
jgi:hypothetical protein